MDDQLKLLYSQVKEGKISQEDALRQIKAFKARYNQGIDPSPSSRPGDEHHTVSGSDTGSDAGGFPEKVQAALKQTVSKLLKVKTEDIDADAQLNDCGFDLVTLTEFANKLNREYGLELTPTIFIEHPTLRGFTGYLLEEYKEIFIKRFPPETLKTPSTFEGSQNIPGIGQDILREKATHYFKKLLSSVIKLPAHRIEADAPMEKYGIDSIMVMKLTDQLEKSFGSLSKTLFFEYQNIRELTGYFLEYHRNQLIELLEIEEKTKASPRDAGGPAAVTGPVKSVLTSHKRPRFVSPNNESRDKKTTGALDIAIIGLSGRYPRARNTREFWENLVDGKDCITEIPGDRWDHNLYFDEDKNKPGKTYSKWGGFLEGVEQFDPLFFNISPQEAAIMDPQERLFLECVYETLEDAGYTREAPGLHRGPGLGGNVGVYVGVMYEEYQLYGAQQTIQGRPIALSGNPSSIANRVSYFCNFHGPSMAVDTMCSSSLTAIHLACHSLQRGECDTAVAGGVNVSIHPNKYLLLGQGKFASSNGRCESFGRGGDGYVPGEGVGAVLLKPLSKAIDHGDHIYGIIKATAINHGGKTNGYFVPNPNAQANVIGLAFKQAGISPGTTNYIEAHGTGTSLGDPIEIAGLTKIFREYTKDNQFCAIGSVKSNIGHCESAAGIAGVTKVLLQLQHRQLVPSLHSKVLNPYIDFSNTPFVVQQELAEWKPPQVKINGKINEYPRRAGVSSFGAGGANAHVVIEEYIPRDPMPPQITINNKNPAIIVLSAKNEERLQEQVQRLLDAIEEQPFPDTRLADMAYTLQVGREAMEERLAVIVGSIKELRENLEGFLEGRDDIENLYRGQVKRNKETLAVFAADEDLQEAISKWMHHRKYEKLLDLWVKGLVFDWNKLTGGGKPHKPRRISLPTYPFAREYCWVPGLDTRVGKTAAESTRSSTIHPLLLHPRWQEQAIVPGNKAPDYAQHLVILCEPAKQWNLGSQEAEKPGRGQLAHPIKMIDLNSQQEEIQQRFQNYALRVFEEIQCILKDKPGGKVLIQVVVSNRDEQQLFSGLSGLLKTAQLENPNIIGQLIEMDPGEDSQGVLEKLEKNSRCPHDNRIRYQDGKPWTATWSEIEASREEVGLPWRDRGVYLITGGLGGLGLIFAGEILQQVKDATLVLTGRSPRSHLNREKQAKLKELQALGARVQYKQVDVSQSKVVVSLIRDIRENFGGLNGIIHSAGVIRDNFIIRKTGEELQEVLAPKVSGLVHLDRASKDLALDFFIFFSSAAGVTGNIGQADYSIANAFMDAYAGYRNALVASKKRQGQTLSIDWPLWKEGGMHIDEETQEIMRQRMGIIAMQTPTGIQALYQALASGKDQVMVMVGDRSRMQEALLKTTSYVPSPPAQASIPPIEPGLLKDKTLHQLKVLFGETIQLGAARIDAEEPLENYGVDSIVITQLNQKLTGIFGELSKTLFYEYRTLEALAGYLAADYPQECMQWAGLGDRSLSVPAVSPAVPHSKEEFPVLTSLKPGKTPERNFTVKTPNGRAREPIAIIGMSGRFPGANTPGEYWENLQVGKNSITEIPPDRWDWKEYYHEDPNQAALLRKSHSKWGGFLDEFNRFDPLFFNMTPREAENIDPQERLFLEECWKALEDAGYAPSKLSSQLRQKTGVFGGITKQGFNLYGVETGRDFPSTSFSSLVNRVSYFLDLQGPSIPIDTMCSSSLAAIHEACEYIRGGRGELAIAGGVNLYLHPSTYTGLSMLQTISNTSTSPAFARGGTGFVPGEGVGVIVLKPYDQALKDGDTIYASIRGTAVNHGGKSNSYTTPNPNQQAAVIRQALEQNNLDPRTISYIEAAANGSEMGDAIEMTALTKVFGNRSGVKGDYKIGSVKPNIGHCESASGMAQLIKVILALNHKTLAPTLLTGELNPNIRFDRLPFQLQQESCEWKPVTVDGVEVPRRAGITNVGAGGVNAHMIVEEYIPPTITSNSPPLPSIDKTAPQKPLLFILSARNKERLEAYVKQWLGYLQKNPAIDLENTAYTLQMGREEMPCRLAIVINSQEELEQQLQQWHEHRENTDCCYFGDVKNNKLTIPEGVAPVIETGDLHQLAKLWILGNSIPWQDLYRGKKLSRVTGLPTYPFKRRLCWPGFDQTTSYKQTTKTYHIKMPPGDQDEGTTNKAVELYALGAQGKSAGFQEEYLTFCPFEEKVPGFSMSGVFLYPETYPDQYELMKTKQIEMRQVLFCKEDFDQIHTLLDIGCGYGTDVIQIAALYPHIQTHGFTITRAQAELGNQRIEQMNLSSQAKIFHKDSSKDAFPGRYDLVIGIEVSFHIRDKQGLFQNIASALKEDGKVLLMDYIANLRGPITDPNVEISIPTRQDWIDILSKHYLVIDEIIDVSPQVANFLYDPDIQQNTANLPKVARDTFQNYANQSVSLEKEWISYCLFKLKKDSNCSHQERCDHNTGKISKTTPYPAALAEMFKRGHIPYPKTGEISELEEEGSNRQKDTGSPGNTPAARNKNQDRVIPGETGIKEGLLEVFSTVLGLQREELEEIATFKELGIGSLNAVKLLEAINTRFNLTLPTSVVFEYNDLDSLAGYIGEHLQESRTKQDPPGDQVTHPVKEGPVEKHDMAQPIGSKKYHEKTSDEIAIIGLSCRCAGANNQDEFRDIIQQGKDCIREIKNKSWLDFFKFNSSKKAPARYGAMENIEYFDPLFFQISPKEAESMDAAQRILLEECYKALEDSGYTPSLLREQPVGTVIGTMGSTPMGQDFSHLSMLGSDTSILAARIAYCLDLKGPALAINTACSSSLTAIDIACQKLKSRDINMAIAGGISIYTHPGAFIAMNNAGMLSPTGVCRPFDHGANGIVVGDGVGVVILKRLTEAQQDNDYIYGIIRGSGTNQDGQTSGITVPSFLAQSQLEESIYRKNQIDVDGLQYIETHGTGTKLGDPVEIHALTDAFKKFTSRKRFCAIGSLKANIGHTTAAAGVLSLIKVLLSLKHKQIPPSINFNKENEHIDFANSPFFVNSSLKEWPVNSQGSRLAAVSSFGFSGTNAHLVIEEYHGNSQGSAQVNESAPGLLVLSAESQEGLQRYAKKTGEFIHAHKDINLADLMYTFQVGREGMSYRLAAAAGNKEELIEQLEQFVEGNASKPANIFVGKVNKKEDINIGDTREGKEFIRKLAGQKKVKKLGELWVKGNGINWDALYQVGTVKRLPGLPTYPFAREFYQVPGLDTAAGTIIPAHADSIPYLHPLLHQNTSDLSRQRFSSTFTGQEFFLADHVLKGQRILPAVAYLEMAQAAVKQAAGAPAQKQTGIRLKNVVWARPIVVKEQPAPVHIELFPGDNGEITYKIFSEPEAVDPGSGIVVHSQGSAVSSPSTASPTLELQTLKTQCNRGTLSSTQCYEAFRVMEIDYGPGHQGIEEVYVGPNQVLAKLTLPSSLSPTRDQFILHPSLMDSAIQASIGLMMGPGDTIPPRSPVPLKLALPFALQELEIHGNCTPVMWALIRYSSGSKPGNTVQKLDIDLCDNQGMVCVRMKGFSTRVSDGEAGITETVGPLMLYPYWKEQAIAHESEVVGTGYAQHIVILCEPEEKWKPGREETEKRGLGNLAHPVKIIDLVCQQEEIEQRFQNYALQVFEEIQRILKDKPGDKVLLQVVVPLQGEQQLFFGLSGLLKTARLENPKLIGQMIGVEPGEDYKGIIEKLIDNSRSPVDDRIRCQDGKRLVTAWREVEATQNQVAIPWKDRGVYLITGGAGGLGLIFAEEIARQVKEATLILIGRSPLDQARKSGLKELDALSSGSGTRIRYKQVDVTQKKKVAGLIQGIREEFGGLHGIIHSAGVIRDNFILKKTREELEQVLAPKVPGLVNLDQASKDQALDFFILFSSAAGAGGNTGQADYSTANAFMDAYAGYRNTLVASKQRQGQTLSINWSLWKQGGMQVDEETQKMMRQRMGITPMQTLTGIQAFYQSLASGKDQVMVVEGDLERLRASLLDRQPETGPSTTPAAAGENKELPAIPADELREKATHYFKKLLSSVINLPVYRIEADAPLEKYGIDSIMVMQMTDQLEQTFGSLSKTLFFEYQNLRELTGYFLESYRERLTELLGPGAGGEAAPVDAKDAPAVPGPLKSTVGSGTPPRFAFHHLESRQEITTGALDIAVIGLSGRYPQARNTREFWENLRDGKDCIGEIPGDRWDHNLYFDEDKNKFGKTYSKWGGFLAGVDEFDPLFFNISPREAEFIDPQERLFLECVFETLEDAGYTREALGLPQVFGAAGNVGVYVGVMYEEYQLYGAQEQALGKHFALSGNPSSIANRVSYFCNFHGPSMAVDTMCSSSLTAIHLACESLQRGRCQAAIAGGVNLSIHPNKYLLLGQGKFVSSKGRCESFGQGGDGYVPGEGVGAVLLKPLSKAIAHRDHIYGIIKATAINHGGKTNGYSVPNPNAQAGVIGQAFREGEIDPRTISYIEAHGTGTSLGDPIEIAGLTKAFREYTPEKQFCAIGSAKSNIGHCESAAGIAGLTKVLLQLQHGQLVPSLHSEVLNPNIDFSDTPFVVQQELTEWKRPGIKINGETVEYPRNAGISSFGAGGSNAHVVIQEYIPGNLQEAAISIKTQAPAIIVLSAKNQERLQERVRQLLTAIAGSEQHYPDTSLADIAYTLQLGREAMEERLAVIVRSIAALREKLAGFLEGRDGIEDLYRGQVKRNQEALAVFAADEELQEAIDKWVQRKKYTKLLDLWVKGLIFDWSKLYRDNKLTSHQPRRISLPTYPFARGRYWVPEIDAGLFSAATDPPIASPAAYLHPLLHQNTSDFSEQRFTSTFTGQEFFLADHVVKGQRILPGAAYFEMARAAVEQTLGAREKSQTRIRLKNAVWLQPIVADDNPILVHIGLFPGDNGQIDYKIYCEPNGTGTEPKVVHSQGTALLNPAAEIPTLDIKALQDECSQASLSSSQLYEAFRAGGIEYGPGHQGVEKIYVGTGQVLAKLSLPSHLAKTREQFVLHPGLLDAAFQASVGLMLGPGDTIPANGTASLKPALAFAVQELEILGACTPTMWALVRYSDGSKAGDKLQKLDIHLCDNQGTICVSMKEITSRVLEGEIQPGMSKTVSPGTSNEPPVKTAGTGGPLMVIPRWDSIPAAKGPTFPSPTDIVLIAGASTDNGNALEQRYPKAHRLEIHAKDSSDEIAKKLETYGSPQPIEHIVWIAPHPGLSKEKADFTANDMLIEKQNQGVLYCFRMIKTLLGLGYGTRELGWTVITIQSQPIEKNHWIDPTHASLHGFFGSLAKEYSNWKIRVIDLEADRDWPMTDMFTLPADPGGNAWGYRGRQWYRQQLVPFDSPPPDQKMYRQGGVYVAIGGAGGIGAAWSEYMIRTYQAQIAWIGRRGKDAAIQAKIDSLAAHGPAPIYIAADAADQKDLEQAYRDIKRQYSQIHGVIHSAVGMLGQSLANLDEEQFKNGLTAKIQVSVRMAQVFQKEPLDFVLFFSSTNSFLKTRGQSSYAAGCTFKDAFAHQLSQELTCTVKIVNWGYWGSVGPIAESSLFRDWMKQEGIGSIEPGEAMEALETLLAGPMKQMALVKAFKPSGLEGLNLVEEAIKIYPEHFTSTGKNLRNALQLPKQNSLVQDLKPLVELEKKEMDKLLARLMWGQLQSIGLFTEENGVFARLKTKIGLPDLYHRWFEETSAVLAEQDYLQRDGNSYRVKDPGPINMDEAWKQWDQQKGPWLDDPNRKAQAVLLEAALRALPEILTGKRPAIDVLFPNSSMELVEGIYKNNPVADYFNEVLTDTVIAFIQERFQQDPSASIRILEIGAGTGGTSAMLFSKLQPFRERIREYCYTDISRVFLMHAEKEYGPQNPYLTYHIFNVSAPVAGQGIKAGVYDIAIAANVLHAAKNIRQALRNSKAALKKNGLLVLNELSGNSLFLHLTFGLLEGWWLNEDPALRIRGCPGLTPGNWLEVLESEGFRGVFFPTQEAHDLGQQVIIAESDGVVRQKQPLAEGVYAPERHLPLRAKSREPGAKSPSPRSPRFTEDADVTNQMLEDYVKETIIEKLSDALKVETHIIDVNESFADYGLDSILAVNLIQVINQALGIELKITALFDYSSINQLTTYILSEYKDTITPTPAQKEKPTDGDPGLTPGKKETSPLHVDSYPNRFLRKSELPETVIKKKEAVIDNVDSGDSNPKDLIAIIGMSGQFAKSGTVNRLWEHLAKGTELIEDVSRWDLSKYVSEFSQANKNYCNQGSFLEDITLFDPVFFNISGVEANYMDPQQRFFLEESWKALEDAGYAGTAVQGRRCGVYVGCQAGDYLGVIGENPPAQAMWGNLNSVLASRIAYFLNLQGPAVAIDTACSSSLVALHLACQGLKDGEMEMALAGGVFIQSTPGFYISGNKAGMLSPSGHCYTFDQRADGFVPGEGVGAVVLKRLKEAIADGDYIYGVIRGSGINQDGTTNGITAPSANSQERLERRVYDTFNINPEDIQVVEAHGTATKLGDPIEFEALNRAFGKYTDKKEYCAIGSIKTNIGHTTAASGIAGLIKTLLSLQHKQIPPSLNFQSANENIRFKDSPFYVNTTLKDWDIEPGSKRCAAISSFGLSGTNAHIVIEEAPGAAPQPGEKPGYLLVISARTSDQLRQQVQQLVKYCEQQSPAGTDCRDISFTLLMGRKHFRHRLACVVRSREESIKLLKKWLEKGKVQQIYVSKTDEKNHRQQPSLKRYGNQCIRDCRDTGKTGEYLENLATIAELYIQGYELEYGQLFSTERCSRISLPTYPFDRGHYWANGSDARFTGGAGSSGVSLRDSRVEDPPVKRDMYILKKQWELCPPPPTRSLERTVAILATPETEGLAVLLARHFPGSQILLPRDFENQDRQPGEPQYQWKNYDGCVDLSGCGTGKNESLNWLAWLAQLVEHGHRQGLMMLCVTRGLESYRENTINLSGASRVGLYRMLQSEYSHLRSRHMDADPTSEDSELAQQIASEFLIDSRDAEVCYRDGKRWRAYLKEMPTNDDTAPSLEFPTDHVLWITGGTRGLGFLCARHFVTRYGIKHLVLTGREELPPREQWDSYRQQNTLIAKKIRDIQALETRGVQVRVLSLPLTDEPALQQARQEITQTMGPIGGIIHCAGITDPENPAFIRKSIPGIQQVLDPKVTGLDIMIRNFKSEPLRFFILFSSVSAIVPGLAVGQSDYAMANAYMDYAAEANIQNCPIISIQWPNWQETGMGKIKTRVYEQTGLLSLTDAEGLQLLDRILAGKPGPVVLPLVVNPVLWKPGQLMQHTIQKNLSTPDRSPHPQQRTAVDVSRVPDDLLQATQQWLISLFSRELKIDASKLDIDTPVQDYGVDSILLAQLLQQINKLVPGELDPSIFYEHTTIESFAAWLAGNYASSLSAALGTRPPGQADPQSQHSLSSPPLSPISPGDQPLIQGLQKEPRPDHAANGADVAVIGLSCRFPGAANPGEYWKLLSQGRSAIGPVPRERWGSDNHFYAGLIDNITHFDPKFFLIPEDDVRAMDPQALVMLDESLNLFYHAGYSPREIRGKPVGVFLGGRSQHQPDEASLRQARNLVAVVGQNYLAANISQFFDLVGPALVLDTACSSALVGMNMAIQALRSGEIESALVGGVSLLTTDAAHRMFQQRGILSREPYFHIFDRRAGGVMLGEGAGMVLLKTVPQALQDGDQIYAVIKALTINNDGRTAGPATPNLQTQKEVMQRALANSGKKPEEISYIEANGSGSLVTDLLELKAIQSIYRSSTSVPCGLGSMKPNIGHPLCAEGIAGFIKVVLMLQHRQWVPFLSGQQPMKHFDLETSPFYFSRELAEWTTTPRIAAINCFADGGTNAHVILQAWEDPDSRPVKRFPLPLPLLNPIDVRYAGSTTSPLSPANQRNGDSDIPSHDPGKGPLFSRHRQTSTDVTSTWKQNQTSTPRKVISAWKDNIEEL